MATKQALIDTWNSMDTGAKHVYMKFNPENISNF